MDWAYNCYKVHIEQFINEMGWLIYNLDLMVFDRDLGPLGLYEEIYNVRALCTWLMYMSHALENIDYLTATFYYPNLFF